MDNISFVNYETSTTDNQRFKLKKGLKYEVSNFIKIISEDENYIFIQMGTNGKHGYIENGNFVEIKTESEE